MRGLLSETVNHKFSAEGIALWVPTLVLKDTRADRLSTAAIEAAEAVNIWSPPHGRICIYQNNE